MGVVNASPDSFSDGADARDIERQLLRLEDVVMQGADLIDIGGQSAITGVPEIRVDLEISRLEPIVAAALKLGQIVSVDTYKPEVARHVLDMGVHLINDTSGLLHLDMIEEVYSAKAGYILMHNRGKPKQRLTQHDLYKDVVEDVVDFFNSRMGDLKGGGVEQEQIVLDIGPDFSKTPSQTIHVLQRLEYFSQFKRPLLLALSRKDFIGAITGQAPRERLPGTLSAIGWCLRSAPDSIIRVHDVKATKDFLAVLAALDGSAALGMNVLLPPNLWRA